MSPYLLVDERTTRLIQMPASAYCHMYLSSRWIFFGLKIRALATRILTLFFLFSPVSNKMFHAITLIYYQLHRGTAEETPWVGSDLLTYNILLSGGPVKFRLVSVVLCAFGEAVQLLEKGRDLARAGLTDDGWRRCFFARLIRRW